MVSGHRAAHLRPQAARCAQYNARTRRLALSGEDCRARAIKDCCAMPHNRPSTIDSCAMPGTIKGGFATPQIAQHHGIRARVTQLPSRTTNRKEDEMFRARPRYRPLLFRRKRTRLIGQKVCPGHLFTPLRTGTLSHDAIHPRQAPLPISAERLPRLP